jgi:uncharacterized phage-associated protein
MGRPYRLDLDKAIEAVAFLLRREPGHRMNYMRLLKILYIAERESLAESSAPITGGRAIAMQRGPLIEEILHLIRGQHIGTPKWSQFIRLDNYSLEMTADPGVGHLSRFVTGKLDEVAQRHVGHDEWDMVAITHELPEWKKNDPGKSSKEIPLADILEGVGRGADLPEFLAAAKTHSQLTQFFAPPANHSDSPLS